MSKKLTPAEQAEERANARLIAEQRRLDDLSNAGAWWELDAQRERVARALVAYSEAAAAAWPWE